MDKNKWIDNVSFREQKLYNVDKHKIINENDLDYSFFADDGWIIRVKNYAHNDLTIIEKENTIIFNNCVLVWCDNDVDVKSKFNKIFTIVMVE